MSTHIRICNGPYCRAVYTKEFPERLSEVIDHQATKGNTSEISTFCLQVCSRLHPALQEELETYGTIEAHVLVDDTVHTGTFSGVVLRTSRGLLNKKI